MAKDEKVRAKMSFYKGARKKGLSEDAIRKAWQAKVAAAPVPAKKA